ncbi:MAG: DUF3881 family protein [Lachnospiraceae bacterium]|nr:DUF3881 family protein [Lachnospiraceae bacterium]
MHKFLRAVGFSRCTQKKEENYLLKQMENRYTVCNSCEKYDGEEMTELKISLAEGIGVILRGRYREDGEFEREYYFPYVTCDEVATTAPCQVQRHAEKDAFSGLCEEYRLGISLIFYIQNALEYEERCMDVLRSSDISGVCLSALSVSGKILIPLKKTKRQIELSQVSTKNRSALLEAARQGDESAMESLTLEDINTYTDITRRMMKEDVYSLLDSCFMPFGVECDQYSVVGTILDLKKVENLWSGEKIYIIKLECNDMVFHVAINEADLLGEPMVGRRFKGDIWLQGILQFDKRN